MPADVITLARRFRSQLMAQDAVQLERLARAYETLYRRLKDKIDLLIAEIGDLENPTRGQVIRLARYRSLIDGIEKELTQYSNFLGFEIGSNSVALIDQAANDAAALLMSYGVADFAKLPTGAVETLLGFLSPEGPLYKRIGQLAKENASIVAEKIVEAVGLGYNPVKLAGTIDQYLGGGLTDALRMARTAQLYTYREATRANYANNADVVQGWIWWAELEGSPPPCMSCVAQHGKIFPLTQTLNDHHNGRCAMLPYVGDNPVDMSGQTWFEKQSAGTQKAMMGAQKYEAWKDGKFDFSKLTVETENDIYGTMKSEASLKALVDE